MTTNILFGEAVTVTTTAHAPPPAELTHESVSFVTKKQQTSDDKS